MDDYYKLAKENLEKIEKLLEGKVIEYDCPYCNAKENISILSTSRAKCLKCNNEFNIKIRLHID